MKFLLLFLFTAIFTVKIFGEEPLVISANKKQTLIGDLKFETGITKLDALQKILGKGRWAGKSRNFYFFDEQGMSVQIGDEGVVTQINIYLSLSTILSTPERRLPKKVFQGNLKFMGVNFKRDTKMSEIANPLIEKKIIKTNKKDPEHIDSIAVGKTAWWFYPEWTGNKKFESTGKIGMVTLWSNADTR